MADDDPKRKLAELAADLDEALDAAAPSVMLEHPDAVTEGEIQITPEMLEAGAAAYFEATQRGEYHYDQSAGRDVGRMLRGIYAAMAARRPLGEPQPLVASVEPPPFVDIPRGKGPAWAIDPVIDDLLTRHPGAETEWRALGIKLSRSRDGSARLLIPYGPNLVIGDHTFSTVQLYEARREQGACLAQQRFWGKGKRSAKRMCVVLPLYPSSSSKDKVARVATARVAPIKPSKPLGQRRQRRAPDFWVR